MNNIKRVIFILLSVSTVSIMAMPDTKKIARSLFTVITYNEKDELRSSNGFFIGDNGEGVSDYSVFKGAKRAVVVDAGGKKWNVSRIIGASDMLNIVKFKVDGTKSDAPDISENDILNVNDAAYVVSNYPKKGTVVASKITEVTKYSGSAYYELSSKENGKIINNPVVNEEGKIVAIVQKNVAKNAKNICALGIKLATELAVNEFSITNSSLQAIGIRKALPPTEEKAYTYLYLLSRSNADSDTYLSALNDFVSAYPDNQEGLTERATFYASEQKYKESEADFSKALEIAKKKDLVYYAMSKVIYNKALYLPTPAYKDWDLSRALKEAENAYNENPLQIYTVMIGKCYYGMKEYGKAYELYCKLNETTFASTETFYYAAKALEMSDGKPEDVLALMDSAVMKCNKPYTSEAAPYIFDRAIRYAKIGKHREAVIDYNEYEHIVGFKNLKDNFYYLREQSEVEAHMYQQAIDDISRAITLNPKEVAYHIENALLMLRTAQEDEAIAAAQKALELNPQNSDAYYILGLIYSEKKEQDKALEYLNKAKELGDKQAEALINKLLQSGKNKK